MFYGTCRPRLVEIRSLTNEHSLQLNLTVFFCLLKMAPVVGYPFYIFWPWNPVYLNLIIWHVKFYNCATRISCSNHLIKLQIIYERKPRGSRVIDPLPRTYNMNQISSSLVLILPFTLIDSIVIEEHLWP